MIEEHKQLIQRLFDEVWNQGKLDTIDEIYDRDFVAVYPPPIDFGTGREGLRALVIQMRNAFPDYHEEIKELIAEGNKVVARFTVQGTHQGPLGKIPPTGKRVCYEEIAIFTIDQGKVISQRGIPDLVQLFQQLGIA